MDERQRDRDAELGRVVRDALQSEGFYTDGYVHRLVKYFQMLGLPRMERLFRPIHIAYVKETEDAYAEARGSGGRR